MPEVTVVIPTRNRRGVLAKTLRTVVSQEEADWEAVVVDDGSTDGTGEAVRAMADPRIRVERHRRSRGVTAARNTGMTVARGEWIAFLDDDDLWAPRKLASQLAVARSTGRVWVYGGQVLIDARDRVIDGSAPPQPARIVADLRCWNPVPAGSSNVMARRSVLQAVGGFDARLTACGDWDLWLRLAGVGPPACVPEPLVAYRQHGGQASLRMIHDLGQVRELEQRHGLTVDWPVVYRWAGWVAVLAGKRGLAFRLYARAARCGGWPWLTDAARADLAVLHHDIRRTLRRRLRSAAPRRRPPALGARGGDREWCRKGQAWLDLLAVPGGSPSTTHSS